ncbi:N(2)-acetyl-L-2,4-diaminobutanoate deacetylase DoeB2 [Salinibius halmophilus]|uniref:N(2)-acetyl-L-2,4-diaminobutanoate deacetylase DoeB2 n=1 Tax=Salinibius halmophilus TaxID=1853216 RepID=UPI000E67085D|nr:N(2)-acetyl-L-2,4-diaminobutanoate deacetylase DoeB2 [Salinibius halmophilus]
MNFTFEQLVEEAVRMRRFLHQHPELTWQEQKTGDYIRQKLSEYDITWRPAAKFGAVATLNSGASGKHIALRGDMDALPISESSGVEWCSQHDNVMHACGHDGHTAVLLATAIWLKQHESQLSGPVSLLFQPAEEGGHGAKAMIDDGALDGIDEIYGWHNWPAISYGQFACPDGPVMAGNGTFTCDIIGSGGHASQPELSRHALLAASASVQALQQVIAIRTPAHDSTVLSITRLQSGEGINVIPDKAHIAGNYRVTQVSQRAQLHQHIEEICTATARAYNCEAKVEFQPRYGVTVNHSAQAENMRQTLSNLYGPDTKTQNLSLPIMASEDFSYYLEKIPGAFALVGADDGNRDTPCHSPNYDFNDRLISDVVKVFSSLVGLPLAS